MVATDICDDRLIHLVATDPDGARIDNATQGQYGHLGGAATDINDHRARRFRDRQAGPDGRSHGFFNQVNLSRASVLGRILNGSTLNGRRSRWHAHHHHGGGKAAAVVNLADEILYHLLGDFEVSDYAVTQGPNSADITGRPAQHLFSFFANGQNLLLTLDLSDGDHGGLIEDNTPTLHVDKRVGRAQIDGHISRKESEKT